VSFNNREIINFLCAEQLSLIDGKLLNKNKNDFVFISYF